MWDEKSRVSVSEVLAGDHEENAIKPFFAACFPLKKGQMLMLLEKLSKAL